ncbi:hypothetical protein [Mulberry dwarf phytoplasma]|nr:hypothetical protein [Mulberry dwarf phytoplasma]
MSAGDLSEQTHYEDPWLNAINISNDWEQNVIKDEDLEKYFISKFKK